MFIVFEGPEGSGKTTVIRHLVKRLQENGYPVLATREPGGVKIAEEIRNVILDKNNTNMDPKTEALLYAAARQQHLKEVVFPALEQGKIVICDRFIGSSLAYQGCARNLGFEYIRQINSYADKLVDLTIFLDIKPEKGLERIQQNKNREVNRLDLETMEFHEKVYKGYQQVVHTFHNSTIVINAEQSVDKIVEEAMQSIIKKIK